MKLLLIDATADTSSKDYFDGYLAALQRARQEVFVYRCNGRIGVAGGWLDYSWRKAKRAGEVRERPSSMDTIYWAGIWSLEMALRLMPDWIVVVAGMFLLKDTMTLLRKATWPHSKLALMVCDAPYDDNQIAACLPLYDAVFTNEIASVPLYQQFNPASFYLPACYDPARHRPDLEVPEGTPGHDVVFVGSGFPERVEMLSAVDWSGIDLGLYGNWQMLGSRSKLRQYVRGGAIPNDRAVQLYRASKIGLNLHRWRLSSPNVPLPRGMAKSLNPRAYELAACQVFQISDARPELYEVFKGVVPQFRGPDELGNQIRGWLGSEWRAGLAEKQRQAIVGHTYDARATQLLEVLNERAAAA